MPWNCLHSLCQPLYCFYLMIFIIIFSLLNRRKYEFKQLFDASNRINTIGNRVLFVIVYFLWFMCWICICWECAAIERLKTVRQCFWFIEKSTHVQLRLKLSMRLINKSTEPSMFELESLALGKSKWDANWCWWWNPAQTHLLLLLSKLNYERLRQRQQQ